MAVINGMNQAELDLALTAANTITQPRFRVQTSVSHANPQNLFGPIQAFVYQISKFLTNYSY
jgi:hypothetical protein